MPDTRPLQVTNVLRRMIKALVDYPDAVQILSSELEGRITFTICCDPRDTGKLIGKEGRTAKALRAILNAISAVQELRYTLNIQEAKPENEGKHE